MLRGTIGDQKLDDVFRLLSLSEKTGRLEVRRAGNSGELIFGAGDVCRAHSSAFVEPLGERLVRSGRISREEVRVALDRQAGDKRRIGELLMEMGIIDPDDVQTALGDQIIDIAVDLLEWEAGDFIWSPMNELHLDVPVAVSVDRIINEFVRRADDLEMKRRIVPVVGARVGGAAAMPASDVIAFAERAQTMAPSEQLEDNGIAPTLREDLFQIVIVCTGNQFRSPIVEGLLRSSSHRLPLHASSVGTANLGPAHALPEAIELASEFGVDLSAHRARTLRNVDLSGADLVLGFEGAHVAEAVVEANAAVDRTFTLVELVELMHQIEAPDEDDPVERARQVVARAHAKRPKSGMPGADLQIRDPLGKSPQVYRETAARLRDLSRRLLEGLFGHTPIKPPPPPNVPAR
jgi:protein-tyrosine phosphatase